MKVEYGVKVLQRFFGWDIGIGLAGTGRTIYIYINLFKWCVYIGKILKL